jgi:hypothetical protein
MRGLLPSASWATRTVVRATCVGIGSAALATVWLGATARAQQARPRKVSAALDAGAFGARAGSTPAAAPAPSPAADAGVAYAAAADGGVHVFKFTELDIEGRLKTPQLVYFLRRVRAEFTAEELGHRSFFREMSETRKESSF